MINRPVTATEVRIREAEWERINQPKYEASLERLREAYIGKLLCVLEKYVQDELALERMTDDGCPFV